MLTIQQIKELLKKPAMADEKAEEIRDNLYLLAEIIFEQWQHEKNIARKSPSSKPEGVRE